jgi:hypothetical protein
VTKIRLNQEQIVGRFFDVGNFCEQYGLPSVAPSKKHKKSHRHEQYRKHKKRFKRFKKRSFEPNDFLRRKRKNLREDLNPRTTKMVVISVVSPVTMQRIAKLRKPLSL